ncbi:conserved hypothetical protein [Synechococcus sp. CC9902]|jgi:hypothetical protein|uniref:DUF1824 family protein n=1 Tax=Synechococcus sp. (strain CC9902) TaxID=316279 RepID=UPI00005D4032|nr:DUF1824 family protein [Synechococcus sp. CC9902]ABB25900.1 conserved hypothetical protein [Synechococcus sp. CC9902]
MSSLSIQCLNDLSRLREAPTLDQSTTDQLRKELQLALAQSSWFTIGVMAPSADQALSSLRSLEASQRWTSLEVVETTSDEGPVFLKANQRGGTVRVRIEQGLGSGILISGHGDDDAQPATTWGPLPLDFFS